MKLPAGMEAVMSRFDRLSLRERGLVAMAMLASVVMLWTVAMWDPITARQQALTAELDGLQQTMVTTADTLDATAQNDPATIALKKEEQLRKELADINSQLASKSAGLIPPERMVQVIQDVLARQRGVTLISLHNKPVTTLAVSVPKPAAGAVDATASGPYVHPVELVIEGRYLDILAYLHALEALDWRFYWKLLELQTVRHPTNRVRIEINTLSMDKDWIGLSMDK